MDYNNQGVPAQYYGQGAPNPFSSNPNNQHVQGSEVPLQGQTVTKKTTTYYYNQPPQEEHQALISTGSEERPAYSQHFRRGDLKSDPQTRIGFVKKVYGILTAQLAVTAIMVFLAVAPKIWPQSHVGGLSVCHQFRNMLHNEAVYPIILVGYFSSICALACCGFDKTVPTNYILLSIFTFCTGWMVSISTIQFKPMIVLEAACLTLAMVFAITLYAMTTSTDFTVFGPLLWIFGMVFGVAGIFLSLFGFTKGLLWSTIGVILFSFYLLYDTQLIMGGENKSAQYDEDSYILAAVNLYLDIINIFLYVLQILASSSD